MKHLLLLLTIAACQQAESSPTPVAPPARNFICERVAISDPKAACTPELSGVGELATHTARVTVGGNTVSCAINAQQVAVVCGPLFVAPQPAQPQQPQPPKADKK
jgi:hypothetical protein